MVAVIYSRNQHGGYSSAALEVLFILRVVEKFLYVQLPVLHVQLGVECQIHLDEGDNRVSGCRHNTVILRPSNRPGILAQV